MLLDKKQIRDANLSILDFCEPAVNKLTIHLSMYLNFLTDMYLFLIPIPMLWTAQLPKAKKIGLAVLFSGGLLTMIFGFLRGIAILKVCQPGLKSHRHFFSRINERNKSERCYGT